MDRLQVEWMTTVYRWIGLGALTAMWISSETGPSGLLLILMLIFFMLLRWRFPRLVWTILLDQGAILYFTQMWEGAQAALVLTTFEAALSGQPYLAVPSALMALMLGRDLGFVFLLVLGVLAGLSLHAWKSQRTDALAILDLQRRRQYELESLQSELLAANVQVARMSELSERSRIAREIHDQAGHEIVAAYMSLQIAWDLLQADPGTAQELFSEALKRLDKGIARMRDTVHNLAPLQSVGVDGLRQLCETFQICPLEFKVYGNPAQVPVYLWSILEPCLKEALTNIMRHAHPTKVDVTCDITPYIVRLAVYNDGVEPNHSHTGMGLRNLKQRARAVGGSISTDTHNGFRLVCVLPLRGEDEI
jgi:signal transduction histidine kinase